MFDGFLKESEHMNAASHPDAVDPRTVVAHGERLAVVETKVNALKDDTTVIRSNIHSINNDLQKIFIIEQRCESALAQLLGLTKDIPTIASSAAAFANMKDQIESVIADRHQRQGAWRAMAIVGTALVGAVSIGAALASGGLWILGHVH